MSVLPIVMWPDPRLSTVCRPVDKIDDATRALAADMIETMYDAPGRGLAAPQVGILLRHFVMDATWREEGDRAPRVLLNPRILSASDELTGFPEGCLSIPGLVTEVIRPAAITLAWTDLDGTGRQEDLDGIEARVALHEFDHLEGLVTLDRLSPEARAAALEEIGT